MSSSPFRAQVTSPYRSSQGYSSLVGRGSGGTIPGLDPRPPPRSSALAAFLNNQTSDQAALAERGCSERLGVSGRRDGRGWGVRNLGSDTQVYREGRGWRPLLLISSYFSFLFLSALLLPPPFPFIGRPPLHTEASPAPS